MTRPVIAYEVARWVAQGLVQGGVAFGSVIAVCTSVSWQAEDGGRVASQVQMHSAAPVASEAAPRAATCSADRTNGADAATEGVIDAACPL